MSNINKAINLLKLMQTQWWSFENLKKLQEKKLRKMVKYAYENIPLYHEKFRDSKIKPEDIKKIEDLVKIPFLTKEEIRNNYPKKTVASSVDISKCWTSHTSGSTGIPLSIVYDAEAEDFEKATALRPNLNCGQKLFDKWAVITCPDHIGNKKWFQRFGLFSQEQISLFEDTKKQVSLLGKINPQILDGYSSSLYLIAKEIQASDNIKVRPKIIYGTSEMLTMKMRNVINSVFNVEMYDQFGCVEMGRTAWECPEHVGYHMDLESVIMEFIKDEEQVESGERGEIVYTNLYNYAMPLIRYKIGDIGIPTDEKCPCGRGLPLMKVLDGRKDAFIQLSDGRIIAPTIWIVLLMHYNLEQFKITQETIDKINIKIVPKEIFTQENIIKLKCEVNSLLGEDTKVEIELVEEIPKEKSGKSKPIVSKIKWDW